MIKLVIKLYDEQNPPSSEEKSQMILEINNLETIQLKTSIQKLLQSSQPRNDVINDNKMSTDCEEVIKNQSNNEIDNTNLVQPGRVVNDWYTKMILKGIKPYRQEAKCLQRECQNVAN